MTFNQLLEKYKSLINETLEIYLDTSIRQLKTNESFVRESYSLIKEYTFSGGKRIRPIAFILSYLASGGKEERRIFFPAAAIELQHTYSLILDDIMDEDELRRNKPTVYKKLKEYFLKKFKEETYNGSLFNRKSSRFSVSNGIMLGNITNILSKQAILKSDFNNETKIKALNIIEETEEKLYHGQMKDVLMEYKKNISEEEYLEMIKQKTGALFEASFELGALFSGANEVKREILKKIGLYSAIAFQIQDDIIDILGEKGHDLGSDIKKGKKTLLMIKALEKSSDRQKKILLDIYNKNSSDENEIKKVIGIMHDTGSIDYSRRLANAYLKIAEENASKLKLDILYSEIFKGYLDFMTKRDS